MELGQSKRKEKDFYPPKFQAAKKSLQFFRGKNYDVTEELIEIQKKHESKMHGASKKSWKTLIGRIFSIAFLKPFSCVGVLFSLSPWVGGNSLMDPKH